MIRAHSVMGLYSEGLAIYNEMVKENVEFDDHTYPFVLKLCSEFLNVKKGLEVHCSVIKLGFDKDVFVNNTLLLFHGNHGNLESVQQVFDEMPEKDIISWNSVICVLSDNNYYFTVINLFSEMVFSTDFNPNEATMERRFLEYYVC